MARKKARGGKAPVGAASGEWDRFEAALAGALEGMPHRRYIVIDDNRTGHCVQFVMERPGLLAETSSNRFLPPESRHDAKHLEALAALGWAPPKQGEASRLPNHYMQVRHPVPSERVAHIARSTLEEVCGIAGPSELTLHAWDHVEGDGREPSDRSLSPDDLGFGGILASYKRPDRVVTLRAECRGSDQFNLWAYVDKAGCLHIDGQDLGPVTEPVSGDGEYEYFKTIAAADVPKVVALLDGREGEPVLDLLERAWTGKRSWELERLLRESAIPVELHSC